MQRKIFGGDKNKPSNFKLFSKIVNVNIAELNNVFSKDALQAAFDKITAPIVKLYKQYMAQMAEKEKLSEQEDAPVNEIEVYEGDERRLFTAKDEAFKNELFLDEAKQFYTALINRHIHDPERQLKVFDPNSVYLPTKKIGKNNPKEAEIEADNAARQNWNRTADMALVSGSEEPKIIEIKNEHVYDEASRSVQKHGWLPGLFQEIIQKPKKSYRY